MVSCCVVQYDWCSWIPNAPPTMRCPPPTEKGTVTIEQIVETLPDRGRSCWHLGAVWALSQFQDTEVSQPPCFRCWRCETMRAMARLHSFTRLSCCSVLVLAIFTFLWRCVGAVGLPVFCPMQTSSEKEVVILL